MTDLITRVLRKLHILPPPFDADDIINASIEDKEREHSSLIHSLERTLLKRQGLNHKLRESIKFAREQTSSFADFEQLTIRREAKRHD